MAQLNGTDHNITQPPRHNQTQRNSTHPDVTAQPDLTTT